MLSLDPRGALDADGAAVSLPGRSRLGSPGADASVDCCALANNHVLDFEVPALHDTLDHLDEAGIAHAGAGRSLDDALTPATFSAGDLDVAVVAVTDNTPEYAAGADSPGVAHVTIDVDSDETRSRVRTALSRARDHDPDLLVSSLHWGPNMVTEPPPAFERFARWLVKQGIDLLHGHSAHVVQGIEVVDGVPVLYDTGDFVDDYAVDDAHRNDRGFLFECHVAASGVEELHCHPVEIENCAVHEATTEAAQWCRQRLRGRSEGYGTTFERRGEGLAVDV